VADVLAPLEVDRAPRDDERTALMELLPFEKALSIDWTFSICGAVKIDWWELTYLQMAISRKDSWRGD